MFDIFAKGRIFFIAATLCLISPHLQAKTLDDFINLIKNDSQYDPFLTGPAGAFKHPQYEELMGFAEQYHSTVKWVPSVAKEVLKLPFHQDRMSVRPTEVFDGWFDEFVLPNQVILSKKAAFITLVHELRHVVHLGSHGLTAGTKFDRLLQQNKKRIQRFQVRLVESNLPEEVKEQLKKLSTRLIETCSEVSAHEGDVVLSRSFGHDEMAESYLEFIQEYKAEFLQAFKVLKKNKFSQNEAFVNDLYVGLKEFMQEKGL